MGNAVSAGFTSTAVAVGIDADSVANLAAGDLLADLCRTSGQVVTLHDLNGLQASSASQGVTTEGATHGAAGDRAAARLSQHGMLPTDLIEELPNLFLQFEK